MVIGVGGVCPGPWLKPQSITKASDISFTSALIKVWLSFLCTTYSHPPTPIHHLPLYTTYPYTPPTHSPPSCPHVAQVALTAGGQERRDRAVQRRTGCSVGCTESPTTRSKPANHIISNLPSFLLISFTKGALSLILTLICHLCLQLGLI